MDPLPALPCAECGTVFQPGRKTQRFCSKRCKRNLLHREWVRKNPERAKEIDRRSHAPKREERNAYVRQWHAQNRDEQNTKRRLWHAEHKDYSNAERARRYFENHETNKATQRVKGHQTRRALPWKHLLKAAEARAAFKNVPFELTHEWAETRWTGNCELTGLPFKVRDGLKGSRIFSPSIDRIRPEIGYTPKNSRFILWAINAMKGEGTDEEIMLVARAMLGIIPG